MSGSTVIASAGRSARPGARRRPVWPSATAASAAWSSGSLRKPLAATISPRRSSAATSASSASAARSTATRLAVRSSSADDTAARKPVSCWIDQLPAEPGTGGAGASAVVWLRGTLIGAGGPTGSGPGADHIDVRRGNLSLLQPLAPELLLLRPAQHAHEDPHHHQHERQRLLDHHDHAGHVLVLDGAEAPYARNVLVEREVGRGAPGEEDPERGEAAL